MHDIETATATPCQIYLATLSVGSQQGMRQALDVIAKILDEDPNADSYPWERITYRDSMKVRARLIQRYRPTSVNKMLAALRGVLKATWRLGLMEADAYRRAADVPNVRVSNLLSGRALESQEIAHLFMACASDTTPKGIRDAAMLAVFYGCGLRRGEVAKLDVEDFDPADGSLLVNGKGGKQRTVYLTEKGSRYLEGWLEVRGYEPGPLFCPVGQTGEIRPTRLRGESIAYILKRLQRAAGVDHFSPHDLRRGFVTTLLDAGVDVFTVQKLAGHADSSTTARYDRRGEGAKQRAVEQIRIPSLVA